jgi:hypothetical protein
VLKTTVRQSEGETMTLGSSGAEHGRALGFRAR